MTTIPALIAAEQRLVLSIEEVAAFASRTPVAPIDRMAARLHHTAERLEELAKEARGLRDAAMELERRTA